MARTLRAAVLGGATLVLASCSETTTSPDPDPDPPGPPELVRFLAPCQVAGVGGTTLCGRYEVYEDRDRGTGRTIILDVLIAKSTFSPAEPDPIIYFHGGPGGSSVENAFWVTALLADARQQRDIVFIDQRGTGNSNKLSCQGDLLGDEASLFGSHFPDDLVTRCAGRLATAADLRLYTTELAVDDIAEALAGLGYDEVNLFGASYGTRMALSFLRRHESRVRSVLLNGVAPPQRGIHLNGAANTDAALEWLFADCESDGVCSAQHPTFRADFATLVSRFDAGPVTTDVELSDGSTASVPYSLGDFGYAVRRMLYDDAADLIAPWVEEALQTGEWAGFPGYYLARTQWVGGSFATGMHLSVLCSEDIQFATETDIQNRTAGTLLGETLIRRYQGACDQWPTGSVSSAYRTPVVSSVPTMIISGERDPVTPAIWGTETASSLSNSLHLIVDDGGHFPTSTCLDFIQNTFLSVGDPQAVPIDCL